MIVGKSSKSRPVSTSLGWQMTTWMPCLTCLAYQASLFGAHVGTQDRRADAFAGENLLQPCRGIVLLRVDREYLAAPPLRQFSLELFDQSSFFGIERVLRKILGFRNH